MGRFRGQSGGDGKGRKGEGREGRGRERKGRGRGEEGRDAPQRQFLDPRLARRRHMVN